MPNTTLTEPLATATTQGDGAFLFRTAVPYGHVLGFEREGFAGGLQEVPARSGPVTLRLDHGFDLFGFVLNDVGAPVRPSLCEVGYWFRRNPRYRDLIEMWRREDPLVDRDLVTQGSFQLVHDRIKTFKVTKNDCYEIYGFDKDGKRVEIYFNPETGAELERK